MLRVILVYDICTENKEGQKRLSVIRKIARKYLNHVQKSVFEGELTEGDLERLKYEISLVVNETEDFVIVYSLPSTVVLKRDFLTKTEDPTSNII